jgi:hypothetical protein
MHWLALGFKDMARSPLLSMMHGLVLAMLGGLITWVAHDRFWLLVGSLSGFMVIAPVLATSLYAMSRAMERGEKVDLQLLINTWTQWQMRLPMVVPAPRVGHAMAYDAARRRTVLFGGGTSGSSSNLAMLVGNSSATRPLGRTARRRRSWALPCANFRGDCTSNGTPTILKSGATTRKRRRRLRHGGTNTGSGQTKRPGNPRRNAMPTNLGD